MLMVHKRAARTSRQRAVEIASIGMYTEQLAISLLPNMHELFTGKPTVAESFKEAGITAADVDLFDKKDLTK